jgi:hypothetical protein
LTIQFETGHSTGNKIHLIRPGNLKEDIPIDSIKYFVYKTDYYYPKRINLETYEIPNKDKVYLPDVGNILFVKRLTKENSKFILYELYKSKNKSSEGIDQYDYFISFPTDDRMTTWNIRGSKFFPGFEEKMSSLVSDCPTLSNKIRQKEKGYFAGQISTDIKKYETIKKIVTEYNNCN